MTHINVQKNAPSLLQREWSDYCEALVGKYVSLTMQFTTNVWIIDSSNYIYQISSGSSIEGLVTHIDYRHMAETVSLLDTSGRHVQLNLTAHELRTAKVLGQG